MLDFLTQVLPHYHDIGAVMPSSQVLARRIARGMDRPKNGGPMRVLEVGPGTGAITKRILPLLQPGDELLLVEINEHFCERLEHKLLQPFRARHPDIQAHVRRESILDVELSGTFDHVVSGLPITHFSTAMARAIFQRMLGALNETGQLSYFEYVGAATLKSPLVGSVHRRRLKRLNAIRLVLQRRHGGRREFVLPNVPPARVVRLRAGAVRAEPDALQAMTSKAAPHTADTAS